MVRLVVTAAAFAVLFAGGQALGASTGPLPPREAQAPFVGKAPVGPVVHARPAGDAAAISRGLRKAVTAGRLTRAEAAEHRRAVGRARAVLANLSGSRYTVLARVLGLVRRQAGAYNRPRALALFTMLRENADYLARRALPADDTDVVGRDGIVYRVGWGYGLVFHPLANVIELNRLLNVGNWSKAARLAGSLSARAVPVGRGSVWEYYLPYRGGSPPWTSGMVQAIGAQAFARTAKLIRAPDFLTVAARAYRAIPGRLVRQVSSGPWIRHYSFSNLVVLNAQLQSALSLRVYGRLMPDGNARDLADRFEASSAALLPAFDTGYWSNYSPRNEAPLEYHLYHVQLTDYMDRRFGDPGWREAHNRFDRYTREPPVFRAGDSGPAIYPWPRDGFRDSARIRFWVSKISGVTVTVGGRQRSLGLERKGWHSFAWAPGRRAPGRYQPVVRAVDLAGNQGSAPLRAITIAVDRDPPKLTVDVARRRMTWRAVDPTTPWIQMRVRLERGGVERTLELGRRPHAGSVVLRVPRGNWNAVLVAADSSGNRTRVPLGVLPAR